MGTVEYVVALEQQMELVPLRRGWWVAFGGPRQPAAAPARNSDAAERDPELDPLSPPLEPELRSPRQRAGTVPPSEPKRRSRREPQPPTPRPMPDPAPAPVPEPPSTPDLPVTPRSGRGRR
jgi:DNA polymerase-3 subunit gamma/tau